ncbi:MAG: hypothetical protein EPN97_12010 [Alphaproteobacteria bacterium]|nr:MAG: hypothetical protein EPN97_12010 [Alphaproteobacteria bacterium]
MTLVKPLREKMSELELMRRRKEARLSAPMPALHQVITGDNNEEMLEQAKEYARELIQQGVLRNVPVEMNCDQPMSDAMVQQFFKDAKKGMLIVHGLEHNARRETFESLLVRTASEGGCILVICGSKQSVAELFASDPGIDRRLPHPFDMNDAVIVNDLADQVKQQEAARIEEMVTVQKPIQPMRPLRFIPKP